MIFLIDKIKKMLSTTAKIEMLQAHDCQLQGGIELLVTLK